MRPAALLFVGFTAVLSFAACGSDSSSGGAPVGGGGNTGSIQTCAQVCPGVLAAQCAGGPANEADCESGCTQVRAKCGPTYTALYQCAGPTPKYTCDSTAVLKFKVSGCESQGTALENCISGP